METGEKEFTIDLRGRGGGGANSETSPPLQTLLMGGPMRF